MSNPVYTCYPSENLSSEALTQLALDLRWSWHHAADELWERLEPELWELTQNPWILLQVVSRQKLDSVTADPSVRALVEKLGAEQRAYLDAPTWFRQAYPTPGLSAVAYFSMEFMLSEALPIYSGGLGNVAGDQLKSASDLGVPVIGVGLLYQRGYFRQIIDSQGEQRALYPFNDPGQLPITPLRDESGEWLRLRLAFPGAPLWVRAWQVTVGRNKLYLLDTNDPANLPEFRGITSELYGGGPELRIMQELVLGVAGWRLLAELGLRPEVCHLNEGHAAFAVLERARHFMADRRQAFAAALAATRAGNLFTTHTAVEAGFDRFAPDLFGKYLRVYGEQELGIPFDDLLALGRRNPGDPAEPFNMAYLAIRGSRAVNGVSRLHGEVSRQLFAPLFPRWPVPEVPVGYVTNGIHAPSWDSDDAERLWARTCGRELWTGAMETVEEDFREAPTERLWNMRSASRRGLVEYTRKRLARQWAGQGVPPEELATAGEVLNPDALTLGFARRFATYKRPNLLLHDRERLLRILGDPQRPVQLILAGKAHPQDVPGQAMIKEWSDFIRRPEVRSRVVFLADYDMLLTQQLVAGVDVWVNTPRRPWEACGTSGMKVLVNGGINLSELDGWWAEAYTAKVGWAIGDGKEHGTDPAWDAAEAEALYTLLEREVIPEFYTRDATGVPAAWLKRMRESMALLTPVYSANRAVREYTQEHYLPAAAAYAERTRDGAALARWREELDRHWSEVHFGALRVNGTAFEAEVYLGELDADAVAVELYAEGTSRLAMERGAPLPGKGYLYRAEVPPGRPAADYTPRVVPYHKDAAVPLEAPHILWQR